MPKRTHDKTFKHKISNYPKAKKICKEIMNYNSFSKYALRQNLGTIVLAAKNIFSAQNQVTEQIIQNIAEALHRHQHIKILTISLPLKEINIHYLTDASEKLIKLLKKTFSREEDILKKICKIETTQLIHKATGLPFDMCNLIDDYSKSTEEKTKEEQEERAEQPCKLLF